MSFYALANALTIGLIFSILALGLYIAFRIVRFPDLTCDGSYALGACVTATAVHLGLHPFLTPVISLIVGFGAGFATGGMYSRLNFPPVVSGIIVMIAAYSINLLIMGVPNLSITKPDSISGILKAFWANKLALESSYSDSLYTLAMLVFTLFLFLVIWKFLTSEIGLQWRCVGIDQQLARRNGINAAMVIPIALGLANGLIALAGSLFVHYQRFADVNMGVGIIMVGLASVFMGQAFELAISRRVFVSIGIQIVAVLLAAIVYRLIISEAYEMGLPTSVFNLVTAGLVFMALLLPGVRRVWIATFSKR